MHTTILRGSTALICLSLALPAAAQDDPGFLGTLVIGGGKRDLSFGTAVSRTVVGEQEIKDRQASTVAQLIDSVPGVTLVNGTTPQGSGINIRGFGANTTFGSDQKIAVLIDGQSASASESCSVFLGRSRRRQKRSCTGKRGTSSARRRVASNSASVQIQLLRQHGGIGIAHDFALPFAPGVKPVLTDALSFTRSFYLVRHAEDRRLDRLTRFATALVQGVRMEVARLESLLSDT